MKHYRFPDESGKTRKFVLTRKAFFYMLLITIKMMIFEQGSSWN